MMKRITLSSLTAVILWLSTALQGFAYNNIYLKVEAYPQGAGKVYASFYRIDEGEEVGKLEPVVELKEPRQTSEAFIRTEATEEYLLAGFARDNGNGSFDDGTDQQVRVNGETGFFSAIMDDEQFDGNGNTTQALNDANNALEELTEPTDYIFAVFTKGDVGRTYPGDDDMGYVTTSKLNNVAGETVTFTAKADKNHHFSFWTDSNGATVGKSTTLTVTVAGGVTYYAHFAEGDAIQSIQADKEEEAFDLLGRKTATMRQGIYVQKGKKVANR